MDISHLMEKKNAATLIDQHMAETQGGPHRPHLGASIIGRKCERELWYTFHWCTDKMHGGRLLRLFRRGQNEEEIFVSDLESIGCEVYDVDPMTGEQFRISDCNGHFGGSLDGLGKGIPEAPDKPHVLEFKTHGDKSFKKLVKEGVEKSKPEHLAQMQIYMYKKNIDRALYMAVNKNDDSLYVERFKLKKKVAKELIEKASRIIASDKPPAGISKDPSWFECKFCDHSDVCHTETLPAVNCRTCVYAEPVEDAKWTCHKWNKIIPGHEEQLAGCDKHLYRSGFFDFDVVAVEPDKVTYQMEDGRQFSNGPKASNSYPSKELKNTPFLLIGDTVSDQLRDEFGGTYVSA